MFLQEVQHTLCAVGAFLKRGNADPLAVFAIADRLLQFRQDNLAAWLSQADQKTSLNLSLGKIARIHRLAETLGIPWPPNGLRHSYISYRIAEVKNAAQVALEAGNSPTIIFKHYRELVTEEDARAWFGIYPAGSVDSGDGAS